MTVLAIDPGYLQSAWVVWDGKTIHSYGIALNETIMGRPDLHADVLVVEEMASYGTTVGKEVFDSVFWSGRFVQAWEPEPWHKFPRSKVRGHLGASKGGDAAVRQALIDRFGPYKEQAIGNKAKPGPLYGISKDVWSALALAVTWYDLHGGGGDGSGDKQATVDGWRQ